MKIGLNNQTMLNSINQKKDAQADSIKKLSTGEEDKEVDPAIAMIANAMMSDVLTDTQGLKNANSASAMMQIADGALSQASDMGTRLQELSVASNNAGLSTSDQNALKKEFNSTVESINSSISSATFNGKALFGQDMTFSLGSSEISTSLEDINTSEIDIGSQDSVDDFMKQVHSAMSNVGSTQDEIKSSANNLMESMTQKSAARSKMSDADMADVMMKYQSNETKLEGSLLVQSHQQNISMDRMAALLN